jgi:hypothetical protein
VPYHCSQGTSCPSLPKATWTLEPHLDVLIRLIPQKGDLRGEDGMKLSEVCLKQLQVLRQWVEDLSWESYKPAWALSVLNLQICLAGFLRLPWISFLFIWLDQDHKKMQVGSGCSSASKCLTDMCKALTATPARGGGGITISLTNPTARERLYWLLRKEMWLWYSSLSIKFKLRR